MAHKHSVYDTDSHFVINPVTRAIRDASTTKNTLIQYDHNSERFGFEIPRLVDGHDMLKCDKVEIHYKNIDSATKETFNGLYEVIDVQESPSSSDVVIFSWLISQNATQYVGTLSFMIRFVCLTDDVIDYVWQTGIYAGIKIADGIHNTDIVVQDYIDILEQWRQTAPELVLSEDTEGVTITVTDKNGTQSVTIDKVQTLVKDANVFEVEQVTLDPTGWTPSGDIYLYNAVQSAAASWAEDIDACLVIDVDMINEAARCQVACTDKGVKGDTKLTFTAYKDKPTIPLTYNIRVWSNTQLTYSWDSDTLTLTVEEK